jgi:cellulose synthase/poly-beta-1,6-N-acetylglucosamine synthase-like glycosyltransferase
MVRASIIIPALNEEKRLAHSLPMISSQLETNDELIVVDNGSTDHTAQVATLHGVKVIRETVRNRSRARNVGLEHSRGQFAVFLDGDCCPEKNWLVSLLAPFADPSIGCVAGEIRILNNSTDLQAYLSDKGYLSQAENFKHPFLPYAGGANLAFRRSVLDAIGVFDEQLFSGHDADLCWRMQLQTGQRIVLVPSAAVSHSQNPSWRALFNQKRRHAHGAVLLYKKYRTHRLSERRPLKQVYWEYRSILKRTGAVAWGLLKKDSESPKALMEHYQLLLEIAEKFGRIEGSLRHCIWYP